MGVTAGLLSTIVIGTTTDTLSASSGINGTTPYSYKWYRSTSNGFTPGTATSISGATALLLNDSGLVAGTQYYYSMIVTDSAATATSATYTQMSVLTAPATKIQREQSKVFGQSAGTNQIAQFGSYAASAPLFSTDPATIQSLSAWLEGWFGGVVGSNNPAMEDMNGFCYVISYFLNYIMQQGVAEYNSSTTYYIGSLVSSQGEIFLSRTNSNVGNPLTDSTNWELYYGGSTTVTSNTTITPTQKYIRSNSTSGGLTHTLPPLASTPRGKVIRIKDVGTGGFTTTVQASTGDLIDTVNSYGTSLAALEAMEFYNAVTTWDVR